jgi:hypothetical protein
VSSTTSDGAPAQHWDLERLTVVAVSDHVSCDLDGAVLILHARNGVYYELNAVGTRVWKIIQAPISASVVRDTILAEYDVEARVCEKDLLALFQNLHECGLIGLTRAT